MSRVSLALALAALVLLATVSPAAALVAPSISRVVTLTGTVQLTGTFGSAQYEVDGYLLVHKDPGYLAQFSGTTVVVVGTELTGPNIYMRKAIEVQSITPKSADDGEIVILPIVPAPPAAPAQPPPDVVILPVQPSPEPEPSLPPADEVAIPALPAPPPAPKAEPVPLFGTPDQLLFGRVAVEGTLYYINEHPVVSSSVDLEPLTDRLVVAVIGTKPLADGRYELLRALPLTGDLAGAIKAGQGVIYSAPERQIAVRLHGKPVAMDQAPIFGNSRTLVGLRAISEALGATVGWDQASHTATVTLGDRTLSVQVGSSQVVVQDRGETPVVLLNDTAPVIVSGRTMIPVRILAECLGLTVGWDHDTYTVILD